jgi:hypothetical protein
MGMCMIFYYVEERGPENPENRVTYYMDVPKERIKRVCFCLYFFTPLFVLNCSHVFDFCLICLNCLETLFAILNDSNKLFELFELVMNMFVNFQSKNDVLFRFK